MKNNSSIYNNNRKLIDNKLIHNEKKGGETMNKVLLIKLRDNELFCYLSGVLITNSGEFVLDRVFPKLEDQHKTFNDHPNNLEPCFPILSQLKGNLCLKEWELVKEEKVKNALKNMQLSEKEREVLIQALINWSQSKNKLSCQDCIAYNKDMCKHK